MTKPDITLAGKTLGALEVKSAKLPYKFIQPTRAQQDQYETLRTALQWAAPYFCHLLYNMMVDDKGRVAFFTEDLQCDCATDDHYLYIKPSTFFKQPFEEQLAAVAHEVSHAMFGDCGLMTTLKRRGHVKFADGSTLPYDQMTMNIAMDLRINAMLVRSQIGKVGKDWVYDERLGKADDSVIDIYRRVYRACPPQPKPKKGQGDPQGGKGKSDPQSGKGSEQDEQGQDQGQGGGKGQPDNGPAQLGGQQSVDQHLPPGSGDGVDEAQGQQDRDQSRWNSAMIAAATVAQSMGKLPAGVEKIIKELLEPVVDWRDQLRTTLSRKVGSGGSSWAQLDWQLVVRGIGAPGRVGFGAGVIVVAYDTSGSIYCNPQALERFMGEAGGIIDELRPRKLYLMACDAKVQTIDECYDSEDLKQAKATGGGDTSFVPVFNKIAEEDLEPEALIYFTDMNGSFPKSAPNYPVIWANINPAIKSAPFGDMIAIPVT